MSELYLLLYEDGSVEQTKYLTGDILEEFDTGILSIFTIKKGKFVIFTVDKKWEEVPYNENMM